MKWITFACALLVTGTTAQFSVAQTSETAIVQGMRNLGTLWQGLSASSNILIMGCQNNTFMGIRLMKGAVVSVDLQKTSSVMNPYLGIVRITGRFYRNSSEQDGSCSRTINEAQRNPNFHYNDQDYQFEAYYQVNGNELQLSGGNEVFTNAFLRQQGLPQFEADSAWYKVFRYPLN